MIAPPRDTSPAAWAVYLATLARMGPEGRLQAAIDLSESIRSIQIDGLLARNPGWDKADAVRYLVRKQFGIELPRSR